ncbi:hypothetical protein EHS25_001023 [Saitozyma podzolica]|uniref:Uncharacterized protein n=1 Tax=Saitozyma podzolica TaxID=1890683 RepID=A0A427YH55_9TREE|nr:hypothetical protein EHS25_001023 [Saitozyma podzolica]
MPAPALTSSSVAQKCLTCQSFLRGACQAGSSISHAFTSFSGKKAALLPERYRVLKRNLTAGPEEALQKSWDDLVEVLKERTEEVATKREKIIPIVQFKDISTKSVPQETIEVIRRTGVAVVKGVIDPSKVESLFAEWKEYLTSNPYNGFPSDSDKKVVYET